VYGGAHLFKAATAPKLGELAVRAMDEHAPDATTFAAALDYPTGPVFDTVFARVREKLRREPVEDFRIDFEDGFGNRPDAEEDSVARSAAAEVAAGLSQGTLPPFLGIRIKSLSRELAPRALRTLELFLTTLVSKTGGRLPDNFVVTLPKIVDADQVTDLVARLEALEKHLSLGVGVLKLELMVETPQSILDVSGRCPLRAFVAAARGRCVGAHFGVYDYTASLDITAAEQRMGHPACDLARGIMQVALAGTGVALSDGATTVMPVGGRDGVHRAWRLHFQDVRHSLSNAYYQGWDLHPGQLATRYAACYTFFLEGAASASMRLKNFVERAAQATLVADVFDDAATGQGLLNYFLRGLACGALTEAEALGTGLTLEELRSRSFLKILESRRKKSKVD
jgi:citrate lyase beta subunit